MIGQNSIFEKNMAIAQKSLGVSVLRSHTIANNISNVDTPYYKRKTVTFETEINKALHGYIGDQYPTKVTDQRHIPFYEKKDFRKVQGKIYTEFDTNYKNDKNNVDIEKEISDEVKNSLYYSAVTQLINRSINRFKSVLV